MKQKKIFCNNRLGLLYTVIICLASICVGLLMVTVYLVMERPEGFDNSVALRDPEIRSRVIAQLVSNLPGVYDSHVDSDVGRILQPNLLDRTIGENTLTSNRFGLRERNYDLPKPSGTVRIVILGDSLVFGLGVAAEDRLGVYLEQWIKERAPDFEGKIEVLHFGVPSWNILSETAFVRRQLGDLRPDLVMHIIIPNDTTPLAGVRGFGQMAKFSPQERDMADSVVNFIFPRSDLRYRKLGYLRHGIDYEGRYRYKIATASIRQLMDAIELYGGQYRLLINYRHFALAAWTHIGRHIPDNKVEFISRNFSANSRYWVSKNDHHWNPDGHKKMAQLIYGLITRDLLLPQLRLLPWKKASHAVSEMITSDIIETMRDISVNDLLAIGTKKRPHIASVLDFSKLDNQSAAQIHGGLDRQGNVSPYASFVLKNNSGSHLLITGKAFDRPEINGARVQIFMDTEKVGEFNIQAGVPIKYEYLVPDRILKQEYFTVRFQSSDYIYQGPSLQHCVVFQLSRLALINKVK